MSSSSSVSLVHVWGAAPAQLDDAQWTRLARVCDVAEQERARRFVFDRDRRAYLAAHGLLRHALSHCDPSRSPGGWRLVAAPNERPELAPELGSRLRFNLSHCATRVVCVVSEEIVCGIDVEPATRFGSDEGIIADCLSPAELAWLQSLERLPRVLAFQKLWTLKEAIAKAVGLGLALPFAELDLDVASAPRLRGWPAPAEGPWWLAQHETCDGHVEALALRIDPRRPVSVSRREWRG